MYRENEVRYRVWCIGRRERRIKRPAKVRTTASMNNVEIIMPKAKGRIQNDGLFIRSSACLVHRPAWE